MATSGTAAVLHGCRIWRNALVGMNAVIMDGAVIGESALVAAAAFVPAGAVIPPRMLVAVVPARVLRALTNQEIAWKEEGTREYQTLAQRCCDTLIETTALTAPEPDRRPLPVKATAPLHIARR